MTKQKQLPNGMPVDAIERVYIKELDRYANQLIDEIREFLKTPLEKEVVSGLVEIFPDEYGDGHLSIGLYLEAELSRHIAFVDDVKDLPLIDVDSYADEESIPDLFVDLAQQWFAECWWKAGGWDLNLPVKLYGHDGFGSGKVIALTSTT